MLREENIAIEIKSQGYECKTYTANVEGTEAVLLFESQQRTADMRCPVCGSTVHIYGSGSMNLRDMPIWVGCKQELCFIMHRYRCTKCRACFTEEVPFKYPGTRITRRAAGWVRELLRGRLAIKAVQEITGIHWDTIHLIHEEMMEEALESRAEELRKAKYKPTRLAVDEFAIHKGHTYATCVMDLDTGEVIWAGKGRSKEDFKHFFEDMPKGYLSDVVAVAMDMNASYNILFTERLPKAVIVYDRYHMQAQYGKPRSFPQPLRASFQDGYGVENAAERPLAIEAPNHDGMGTRIEPTGYATAGTTNVGATARFIKIGSFMKQQRRWGFNLTRLRVSPFSIPGLS